MTTTFRARVAEFAGRMTPETLERLADEVLSCAPAGASGFVRIGSRFADPDTRHQVSVLLGSWSSEGTQDPHLFAECLRAMAASARWQAGSERLELVWSGPRPVESVFRRSDEALLQVVREAAELLTVVTFAAYRVPFLAEALAAAIERGVAVQFVGETEAGSEGRLARDAASALGPALSARIEILEWPLAKRSVDAAGRRGLLHAKFALADARVLFVSSANLTEAALDLNMEMGVLITGGPTPVAARKHLDRLQSGGLLRRVPNGA